MQNINDKKIVTRFAPSPTGFMHVGNVRAALYAWLWTKKNNGTFILRIEDTDKEREVSGSVEHIQESLKWLGLNWDEGPGIGGPSATYLQSERLDLYKKYAQKLIDGGFAYTDNTSEEQIEELRKKAEEEKRPFLFREFRPQNPPPWDGTMPLRFKVPTVKDYHWHDMVFGDLSAGPEMLDDFILIKSDGYPTYNFAHIVDDIEMGVTLVMRGQEYIASTPKYLSVYGALGVNPPEYACLPHIMADGGKKKLGKRDGAKDILEYRKEGYLPVAMINFLAFLGWNPGGDKEIFTTEELIKVFEISKIQKSGAQLNSTKLDWLNKEHMKLMSENERNTEIINRLKSNSISADERFLVKLCPVIFDHISKWGDIDALVGAGELEYYFHSPEYNAELLSWKGSDKKIAKMHLEFCLSTLESADDNLFTSTEKIKSLLFDYATEKGRGEVLWPLRVALSGKDKSPDPFTLIYILGKEETASRIQTAIKKL
ncbi:MAG: glutamate--tRNA ligase [Candidatus Zambryskibacteria bacterium RIFOXYD1_FULL_40_13]|nr:MAG: glutamyl-tRNA synthetase [Parcubacteria group bacterium GW2011_GWC1_39_12]KKR19686.1 MAG: glutamyl-tRNA synthetase [Parcubacteria group bacterium GW2011_GWF1_39_37]KKR35842.1 MAG: glutamyl-tRNA synthetase [Parcubacteria group bacterium GW2011_GWC2_40_10]KKR52654.1 MAG: glutamyl-tRNA synthetase [Parcubacteria group bacterium GW2011_GWE1_40_20]KKR69167.1 MAG: glutamyl-tRNA synthetase [Parcubacteria group bacterium GW2011_GWF2_40_69]KKR82278.1 MAG: glutamyl-tRNA synthetase [Parcubacteria 